MILQCENQFRSATLSRREPDQNQAVRTIAIHTDDQLRAMCTTLAKGVHVAVVKHVKRPVHPDANLKQPRTLPASGAAAILAIYLQQFRTAFRYGRQEAAPADLLAFASTLRCAGGMKLLFQLGNLGLSFGQVGLDALAPHPGSDGA